MVQKFLSAILISAVLLSLSCSKKTNKNDDPNDVFVPIPEAQYNNSNYGVYRGVFIGSKGYISILLNNTVEGDITWGAILKIDGIDYEFKPTQNVAKNLATTLNFTSGANSFTFNVDANGANPTVTNLVISSHPKAKIVVAKSLSNLMVDLFECTYKENRTGGETGVIMLAMAAAGKIIGLLGDNNLLAINNLTGTQSGNQVSCTVIIAGATSTIIGIISNDITTISGTFTNANGGGTWTGKRIL